MSGPAVRWLIANLGGSVTAVVANEGRSNDLLVQAQHHLGSAAAIAASDPTLALAALHDAIRKALDADAGALGYRFENRPGAHRAVLECGGAALGGLIEADDLEMADRLRLQRHAAEYGIRPAALVTRSMIDGHAAVAARIVTACIQRQVDRSR